MLLLLQYSYIIDLIGDTSMDLETFCTILNTVLGLIFIYLKYIISTGLILIGFMVLLKFRGIYKISRVKFAFLKDETGEMKDGFKGPRMLVGFLYIIIGIGILFNFLTYFLYLVLDPLPDRFVFLFINFSGDLDPQFMQRIQGLSAVQYPHEQTIIYGIAYGSLSGLLQLLVTFYLFVMGAEKPQHLYGWLISTISFGLIFGFTTCLPFLL